MKKIRKDLEELKDEQYAKWNEKFCPDTNKKILGIRIPKLRKLAKNLLKTYNITEILEEIQDEYLEEVILQGFVIGYADILLVDKIPFIEKFLPKIDSWAITDSFVPTLNVKEEDLHFFWKFILPYTQSDKEFLVRFSVVCMLDYYITEEYVDDVLHVLDSITHNGYYAKMSVAWTLAEIGAKFNNKAMLYLSNKNHLDTFTYHKTLQKMIESYRISADQKEILRQLKRKSKKKIV